VVGRRSRRAARASRERGAVAVEFVLVLPLLMALLVGITSAGLGYNKVLGVADGVREGARFGATASPWAADTVRDQAIALTTLNIPGGPVVVTSNMVCADLVKAPATTGTVSSGCTLGGEPANPSGVVAGTCLVKVWAQIPIRFDMVLLGSYTPTVARQSVTLYERGAC
jgi:Flp pilus assembly protein TadG